MSKSNFAATAPGLRAAGQEAILAEEAAAAAELEGLVIDEFGGAPFVSLEELMDRFVDLHAGRHRQRTAGWLAKKAGSIGGSEIAALMGYNPYSSFDEVVASKVGVRTFTGNIACQWGTMFESAIERFVEIDCGTRLAGTDISVPAPAHSGLRGRHANSPDGYGVITLFAPRRDEGEPVWRILSTDAATRAAAEGRPTKRVIVLLEFKCPYRRQPKGEIPKHYKPQLWSGLALSPIAHLGIFVDAAFRKCALWNLGPETGYDWSYHRERKIAHWGGPIAWGLTAIYAPRLDAPVKNGELAAGDSVAGDDDDLEEVISQVNTGAPPINAAYEAWHLHYKNFGIPFESPQEAAREGRPFAPDPIDFGDCEKSVFETMMLHLDKKRFRAEHFGPCYPDGRGAALRTGREIGAAVDGLAARAPAHHYLLGVVPWKIFEVDYAFVERREGFLAEIAPLVHSCLDMADRFRAEEDPARAYFTYLEGKRQARWASGSKKTRGTPNVTVAQVQDLFDAI